ncbi:hypothetical protein Dvina_32415 [Dactylosporangium vinaceum]|uniref:Secreted protein n=1 Tax=Dactylosporangium vinaceum TaxID=53362 RepID=A0ABV5MAG4_9ACTN|nr:hypothetical protein [Dactylosporangium vinaceum]UAB92994.1 hypothetical protein Dvina_32415 [Dactylosporangium vinaceum]
MKKTIVALATAGALIGAAATPAGAATPPEHHSVICDSASFYAHYTVGEGPFDLIRTLYYGNDVGHTHGAQAENNGWGYTQDFGPNDWGWMQLNCMS